MGEPKSILCPQCGRKVGKYDGRATVNIAALCERCRKRVVYMPATDETIARPLPERASSSGKLGW